MLLSLIFLLTLAPFSAEFQFFSLAWDLIIRHFIVGSISVPNVYVILDVGAVKCLVSEPSSHINCLGNYCHY
jgi:hypothetical protein